MFWVLITLFDDEIDAALIRRKLLNLFSIGRTLLVKWRVETVGVKHLAWRLDDISHPGRIARVPGLRQLLLLILQIVDPRSVLARTKSVGHHLEWQRVVHDPTNGTKILLVGHLTNEVTVQRGLIGRQVGVLILLHAHLFEWSVEFRDVNRCLC